MEVYVEQKAFQITITDNVATALTDIAPGTFQILGDSRADSMLAVTAVAKGHKIALCDIAEGSDILKYGITIGKAITDIAAGEWVHLHNIRSCYDERSSHLDTITGVPKDIRYE